MVDQEGRGETVRRAWSFGDGETYIMGFAGREAQEGEARSHGGFRLTIAGVVMRERLGKRLRQPR